MRFVFVPVQSRVDKIQIIIISSIILKVSILSLHQESDFLVLDQLLTLDLVSLYGLSSLEVLALSSHLRIKWGRLLLSTTLRVPRRGSPTWECDQDMVEKCSLLKNLLHISSMVLSHYFDSKSIWCLTIKSKKWPQEKDFHFQILQSTSQF